ncbi:MAG: hypothetical protein Q8O55_04615 [Dehalococcoidales bacterium]|nr:hypothetical protein [Dehalococcoidales bacterium]
MKFVKALSLSLLGFFLFLALSIFGLLYMLDSTLLKPEFVVAELNSLDASALAEELVDIESPPEVPNFEQVINKTVADVEPVIKEELGSAIFSVYDYLLGKTDSLDLKSILRNTFFSADFVSSVVDNTDISSLAGVFISQQFAGSIPVEITNLDKYITDAIAAAEPSLKEEIVAAADPVFDYLLMESQTLDVSISLEEVKRNLRDKLLQVFLESPPPELAAIPPNMREPIFNQFYDEFSQEIPSTFQLDETVIGTDAPANIAEGIAQTTETLTEIRQYVAYFQLGYKLLIVIMLLLVAGIILISRDVVDISRRLGTPLLTYGALQYAGIWLARYFAEKQVEMPGVPASLQSWIIQLSYDLIAPLEVFSLALLVGGVVLVVVSFVYKRRQPPAEE